MNIEEMLIELEWRINRELDRIHDQFLAKLETMARSTGQRTRADRL
jgi:hypothetical protein